MHSFPVIANKFVFIFKEFKCGIQIPCQVETLKENRKKIAIVRFQTANPISMP